MQLDFQTSGDFSKLDAFLAKLSHGGLYKQLEGFAEQGVTALRSATPMDSGRAADSWYYEINITMSGCSIHWCNRDIENGFPVAVMVNYGYSTGTGGYVAPRQFINPAMKPVFDKIAESVWKVVTSA